MYLLFQIERPDVHTVRVIDCYLGKVNGFAYGSMLRFKKMKRKGVIKPVGPCDMFKVPPTTSTEVFLITIVVPRHDNDNHA